MCTGISAGVTFDPCDPMLAGIGSTIMLANKADVSSVTQSGSIVTSIIMKTGKRFWDFVGAPGSLVVKQTTKKGKYITQFYDEVTMVVFAIDPITKDTLQAMVGVELVAIAQNNQVGATGNSKYEYIGQSGMKVEVMDRSSDNPDTLGAYEITIKTQDYALESKLFPSIFITNAATTETLVRTTLLTPA